MAGSPNAGRARKPHPRTWPTAVLDRLIEEAIVDAYGESEQTVGFFTMLEDHLAVPFATNVLDTDVIVERVDLTDDERIVAVCSRKWQWLPRSTEGPESEATAPGRRCSPARRGP